jgi:probable HAF family extracellular repeat protein
MRIRIAALALVPLCLLTTGCSDQLVLAPEDASFKKPAGPGGGGGGGGDGGGGVAYEIVTLGTLGGSSGRALAINHARYVVGETTNAEGEWRGFVWTEADGMRDLFGSAHEEFTGARHINQRGEVAGHSRAATGFVYDLGTGQVVWLPALPGQTTSQAIAINGIGIVVGRSGATMESGEPDWRTVVWIPAADGSYGEPLDLACPAMQLYSAINRHGDFVVSECLGWRYSPAYLFRSDDGFESPIELGTLGGWYTMATGIDDDGKVAGWSTTPSGQRRAVVWHPADYSTPIDLGDADSVLGMNNGNRIVGARSSGKNSRVAVIWTVDDAGTLINVQELATPGGFNNAIASGINDENWVVGEASKRSGSAAFLWRPQP